MVCYLGLGSNLGRRATSLAQAVAGLAAEPRLGLLRLSSVYETTPVGYAEQPPFLNMVVALRTECSPEELLQITQTLETRLGRTRPFPNAPRTLDVDLLLCGDEGRNTSALTLPHPRMRERQFVLVPLAEIAPDLVLAGDVTVANLVRPAAPGVRRAGTLHDMLRSER